LHGVQVASISNNEFANSSGIAVMHTVGEPVTSITNNKFVNTPAVIVKELNSDKSNTAELSDNFYKQSQN
jgi:poly(beta-D-mannuronate) lyase